MAISLMAARLFENAFKNFDFTGWPEFQDFGDTKAAHMMLSTDKKDMNMYSVIVNSREIDDDIGYTFTLLIEPVAEELHFKYNFLVKDIAIHEINGIRKIGICVGKGQDLILDVLDRPAFKPEQSEDDEDDFNDYVPEPEPKRVTKKPKVQKRPVDDADEEEEEQFEEEFEGYEEEIQDQVKQIRCPNCGSVNRTEWRVCKNCGNMLILESPKRPTFDPPQDDDDDDQKPSWADRRATKKANKKQKKGLLDFAKRQMPPKGKIGFANHRKP